MIDASYGEKGWAYVRGAFSAAEVEAWRAECDGLFALAPAGAAAGFGGPRLQSRRHDAGGTIVDRLDPVVDISPLFRDLAADPRVVSIAAAAVGRPTAALFKDKLIVKRPGTHGYGMHQDFAYWESLGAAADAMVNVLVAIDPAGRENGAVELFPGLHRKRLPAAADDPRDVDEASVDLSRGELAVLAAGDLLVFHSLVPHRSAPNRSKAPRRALFLTYTDERHAGARRAYYTMRDR